MVHWIVLTMIVLAKLTKEEMYSKVRISFISDAFYHVFKDCWSARLTNNNRYITIPVPESNKEFVFIIFNSFSGNINMFNINVLQKKYSGNASRILHGEKSIGKQIYTAKEAADLILDYGRTQGTVNIY